MSDPKIIVALDFPQASSALALAQRLEPALCRLKVGKELFTAAGPQLVEQLQQRGFEVFLDLKFHDIPNTTAQACKAAAALGVWMVNVHALGGKRMMEAAREALANVEHRPKLIAVTVLTSMAQEDLHGIGINASPCADGAAAGRVGARQRSGWRGVFRAGSICAAPAVGQGFLSGHARHPSGECGGGRSVAHHDAACRVGERVPAIW